MKISLTIQMPDVEAVVPVALLNGSLEDKLRKAAEFGADGVELLTTHPDDVDRDQLLDLLDRYHLQVAAIASGAMAMSGFTLLSSDLPLAQEKLAGLIHLAQDLNAPTVTIGSFRGRAGTAADTARARLVQILRDYGEMAAQHNVRLALEPLNRYETDLIRTADEGLEILQAVDRPAVGLLLDVYQGNIEEASRTEPFRKVAQRGKLFHVHVADNNRLAPGWGMVDFSSIVDVLNEVGYQGWLSAELLPLPDPDAAARQTVDCLRPLVSR